MISIELVIWTAIILASVMLVMAVRKIAVQYARRNSSGGFDRNIVGSRQYIPLRLNASGVMPIIFASTFLVLPVQISQFVTNQQVKEFLLQVWDQLVFKHLPYYLV